MRVREQARGWRTSHTTPSTALLRDASLVGNRLAPHTCPAELTKSGASNASVVAIPKPLTIPGQPKVSAHTAHVANAVTRGHGV